MQNDARRLSINLGQKREESAQGIFLSWITSRGKIIIIVVELLALGALGYRFVVDRQIVDLTDQIKKQQIFIEAQKDREAHYRNIQTRIAAVATLSEETTSKVDVLRSLFNLARENNFTSNSFSLTGNTISIDGQAGSLFSLNTFIDAAKRNDDVTAISIEDLSNLDQGVRFRLTIQLKSIQEV